MKLLLKVILLSTFVLSLALPAVAGYKVYPEGQMQWMVEKTGKLTADVTVADNGLLYCTVGNKVLCFDVNTGFKLWERKVDVGGKITEPLLVVDGTVYAPGAEGIQQMSPNGSLTWLYRIYPKPKGSSSTSVVSKGPEGLLYLGLADGLYALEPKKNFKWRYSDEKNVLACLGDENAVYVVTGDKDGGCSLRALDKKGERIWHKGLGDVQNARLTLGPNGQLYVVTNPAKLDRTTSGKVQCINKETGREIWSYSLNADDLTKLSFDSKDNLYLCGGQRIYAINYQNGTLRWNLPLLNVSSAVAIDQNKQRLYAGSTDGRIFCVGFGGRLIWDKEIDKTTSQTLGKDGGIMVDTGKDEKDSITRAPILLKDGGILVTTDKGALLKFKDAYKES